MDQAGPSGVPMLLTTVLSYIVDTLLKATKITHNRLLLCMPGYEIFFMGMTKSSDILGEHT